MKRDAVGARYRKTLAQACMCDDGTGDLGHKSVILSRWVRPHLLLGKLGSDKEARTVPFCRQLPSPAIQKT